MNIVLAGFMGSGKTTVGRLVAQRLGWDFVDTDALIEARTGQAIPAIFAERGEAGFRDIEAAVVQDVAQGDRQVIATGGGAVLDPRSLLALRMTGAVVHLKAPSDQLWRRTAHSDRPLAQDPVAFRARYQERLPLYQSLPIQISAAGSPARVADRVIDATLADERQILVPLPGRTYPIVLAPNALARLGTLMAEHMTPGKCLLVTNTPLEARYAEVATTSLRAAGWDPHLAVVPAGERFKRMQSAMQLYDRAIDIGLERRNPIIALGGGVIGDLAGFVAATFNRGLPFVQVPTSLLAQIDSSVGGKVAVNHPRGKNLIGAFHQPALVVADPLTLHTLPRRELVAGLAELVKYGVILDAPFFERLESDLGALLERRMPALLPAIARACELKAQVVVEDERESGLRAILNFGHTVAHAVEAEMQYQGVLHGEAVAMGMVAASALAREVTGFPASDESRLQTLLERAGLPTRLPALDAERLMAAMGHDKKVQSGRIRWVLPRAIGAVELRDDVSPANVIQTLRALGAR